MDIVERLQKSETHEDAWRARYQAASEIKILRQQNAELVEALEHLLRFVKTEFDPADIIVFKAQDAIAKATGGE